MSFLSFLVLKNNLMSATLTLPHLSKLENSLLHATDNAQRLVALFELIDYYTFTNIHEAQRLLTEHQNTFTQQTKPELLLPYHLNYAIVENQLYNYQASDKHFQKALEIVENEGNATQQAEVYIDYAGTLMNLNERERALEYLDKARRHLEAFPNNTLFARLYCREGYLYWQFSDYDRATELFFKSDKRISGIEPKELTIKDLYFQILIYTGLGLIYEKTGDWSRCVTAYLRVVDLSEKAGIGSRLAWHYLNVGKAYMAIDDYDHAEGFFKKVNLLTDDLSQSARAYATANLGYCYYLGGRYQEALEHYNSAELIYRQKEDDYENLSIVSRWIGLVYDAIGKVKWAENRLVEALDFAQKAKSARLQAIVCRDIAELYADRGDYKNAYEYEVLQNQFVKKYYEEQNSIKINELEFKYEAERRRKEAELLRLQATGLQLKALRAQMNPHFMFNALNSIQNYINADNREFAAKYLAKFAKLMRSSLEYSESEIISLENEIEFLTDYLYINQKLRFEDKLQYKITVDEEIEDDLMGVPTMIVQPYIENAIEHGLRSKRGGLLKIDFKLLDEKTILCSVEDNGIGRDLARKMQERDAYHLHHKSRGTSITEKRLEILHSSRKDKFSVTTIDLRDPLSNEPIGTRVEIKIPIVDIPYKTNEL
jgi:two-component system, LytTR family, sensor kinase